MRPKSEAKFKVENMDKILNDILVSREKDTLVECEKINDGSRFRIKSDVPMTQADTKQIQIELFRP